MALRPGLGRSPGGGMAARLPGEPHGQRGLLGDSPRGHKEQHTTERPSAGALRRAELASGLDSASYIK